METYTSTCHCTAIRLSFKIPSLTTNSTKITQCNCSICTKNGYLLVYPRTTDVTFHSGESEMAQYRFGNLAKPHKFCARCGTSVLIDFGESLFERERGKVAVNVYSDGGGN
ncbi:hypothetical protein BDV25DRAFT_154322 [Aspergillus avenaceus]|uniref:CENP-V/GFA domain-containing protein n=1 Tax=Aspergillus avenaceus TaxID=36643 RepID=A0A5N6TVT4_ASPAV|nr:hypothetical protein BDV25DRAFT_154322 [Aspergillus avenaceus]